MILSLLFLLQSGFVFSDVQPWRWSEGRGERIPALSAQLENRTGRDWAWARFRVRVHCDDGSLREYPVFLRDVPAGKQRVEHTAWDFIGRIAACDGPAEVLPEQAAPYPEGEEPAYFVLGFSLERPGSAPSADLEGIIDYRAGPGSRQELARRYWRVQGTRLELPSAQGAAVYCFRVPPGRLGLAGFLLPGEAESPLSRFLRYYELRPGQVVFAGVFRLQIEGRGRASVEIDPAAELAEAISQALWRPVNAARGAAPGPDSTLVIGKQP